MGRDQFKVCPQISMLGIKAQLALSILLLGFKISQVSLASELLLEYSKRLSEVSFALEIPFSFCGRQPEATEAN